MREKREIARAPADARSEGREVDGRNKNSSRTVDGGNALVVLGDNKKFQDGHNLI